MKIKESQADRKLLNCDNYCLFDLENDPTETTDVKENNTDVLTFLKGELERYRTMLVPQKNKQPDARADPKYCNGAWFTWESKFNFECINYGAFQPSWVKS